MLRSLTTGARTALREPWLAALLWAWSAALALAAALPAGVWLSRGLAFRPRGDVLLDGFSWNVFKELTHYDASSVVALLGWAALGPIALSAVAGALVNGGTIEAIWPRQQGPDPRPRLHRFFRGAGRFFLVNLRLLVLSGLAALILVLTLQAAISVLSRGLDDTQVELLGWAGLLLSPVVTGCVAILWGTVLDFARLRVVATDGRSAVAALRWALPFVARHPAGTVGIWAVPSLLRLGLALAGAMLVPYVPAHGWGVILATVVTQQLLVLIGAFVRVGTVAAEVRYASERGVAGTAPSVPAGEPEPPPDGAESPVS